jgi:hypothetical protein
MPQSGRHSGSSFVLNRSLSTDADTYNTWHLYIGSETIALLSIISVPGELQYIYIFSRTWCQIRELMCRCSSPSTSYQPCARTLYQCCRSVTFLYGSGSGSCYFHQWPSRRQQKTNFLQKFFCILLFERTFTSLFTEKSHGSGFGSMTNGSGSGSRAPKTYGSGSAHCVVCVKYLEKVVRV